MYANPLSLRLIAGITILSFSGGALAPDLVRSLPDTAAQVRAQVALDPDLPGAPNAPKPKDDGALRRAEADALNQEIAQVQAELKREAERTPDLAGLKVANERAKNELDKAAVSVQVCGETAVDAATGQALPAALRMGCKRPATLACKAWADKAAKGMAAGWARSQDGAPPVAQAIAAGELVQVHTKPAMGSVDTQVLRTGHRPLWITVGADAPAEPTTTARHTPAPKSTR